MRARGASWAQERFSGWGIAASTLLHILISAFVLLLSTAQKLPDQPQQSIEVEFATLPPEKHEVPSQPSLQQPENVQNAEKLEAPPQTPALPEISRPREETPAMVKPSHMLSEKLLADPRSRQAREQLALLAPDERVEQLCNAEAMAQVGAWSKDLKPDRVVAYAMAAPKLSGNSLSADGAALHSKKRWYRLRFKCDLTPDRKKVVAFGFLMGDPIPRKEWGRHSLPSEDKALD
ncbi:DUF930 domain-containing protein [Labrys portucalensis]|uniref:DUF930 domain-containing protein n=1 Tax=Labrys neptuniae TaxID=376174 RepID=A0ABV6ZRT0_9HYPH